MPDVESLRGNRAREAALSAITAAVTGVDRHGIGTDLPVPGSIDWRAAALAATAILAWSGSGWECAPPLAALAGSVLSTLA